MNWSSWAVRDGYAMWGKQSAPHGYTPPLGPRPSGSGIFHAWRSVASDALRDVGRPPLPAPLEPIGCHAEGGPDLSWTRQAGPPRSLGTGPVTDQAGQCPRQRTRSQNRAGAPDLSWTRQGGSPRRARGPDLSWTRQAGTRGGKSSGPPPWWGPLASSRVAPGPSSGGVASQMTP